MDLQRRGRNNVDTSYSGMFLMRTQEAFLIAGVYRIFVKFSDQHELRKYCCLGRETSLLFPG